MKAHACVYPTGTSNGGSTCRVTGTSNRSAGNTGALFADAGRFRFFGLEEVTLETKESSSASVFDGHEIVYVARVQTRRIMSVSLGIGSRLPAFCLSMERALLAQLPPEELEKYFRTAKFRRFTEKTICDPLALRKELSNIFKQGYAKVDQKLELGAKFAHGFFERSDDRLPSLGQTRCSSG
jgi:Bacterial transcriptional regulator